MCGIIGVASSARVHELIYEGLNLLQHRGQDAAGIFTMEQRRFYQHKGLGLVRDVFSADNLDPLRGNFGIGHVRYPTVGFGSTDPAQAQPLYVNSPCGIALIHNGNLVNADELGKALRHEQRHLNSDSDSEVLLNVLAAELHRHLSARGTLDKRCIVKAVSALMHRCLGAYSVIALLGGKGVIAFRDPYGIRPLVYGSRARADGKGRDYLFASESVALDVLGFQLERDLRPGELIYVDNAGKLSSFQCYQDEPQLMPCIFEYVYLARPDSILEGVSVYQARLRQGEYLARRIRSSGIKLDVVMPVPDTGRVAAQAIADHLGLPIREGLMRNRYVGRTFIMRGQHQRQQNVRRKLNLIPSEFAGRNVLLVDDSIVRGTTSRQIVKLVHGFTRVNKIYIASVAPPVRFQNVYGIDMPTTQELVAHKTLDEDALLQGVGSGAPLDEQSHAGIERTVCRSIGADGLFYQRLEDLVASVAGDGAGPQDFELSIFNGDYVTGGVSEDYLARLSERRMERPRTDATPQMSLFGEQRANVSALSQARNKRAVGALGHGD